MPHQNVEILNEKNQIIPSDKICFDDEFYLTNKLDCDLYFKDEFNAFEFKNYHIIKVNVTSANKPQLFINTDFKEFAIQIDNRTNLIVN